jgi:LysR family transcriptional activator of nhaA
MHELDAVLTDAPVSASVRVRAFSHLIGESPIALFAGSQLARRYRRRFPRSLDGAPLVLPEAASAVRRALDDWLHAEDVHPDVKAECEDIDLLYACGQAGLGLFPAPVAIAAEVCRQYHVVQVGIAQSVMARFYAISAERRLQHPAVVAITESGRRLFT